MEHNLEEEQEKKHIPSFMKHIPEEEQLDGLRLRKHKNLKNNSEFNRVEIKMLQECLLGIKNLERRNLEDSASNPK